MRDPFLGPKILALGIIGLMLYTAHVAKLDTDLAIPVVNRSYLWLIAIPVLLYAAWKLFEYWLYLLWVASCLIAAEHDLNDLLNTGLSHEGRKSRIAERYDWNTLDKWAPPLRLIGGAPEPIGHELIRTNEEEMQSKRRKMKRATFTALLLRDLYSASPSAALARIRAVRREGKEPYIAPGIYELLLRGKKPVGWRVLRYVVSRWRLPQNIQMVKGPEKFLRGHEVINELSVHS